MLKKVLSIIFVILAFVVSIVYFIEQDKIYKVVDTVSPTKFKLDKGQFVLKDFDSFDSAFTQHNAQLANELGISESEAFILGNLGKYWAGNSMNGRRVYIKGNSDLVYYKYSYCTKFMYSGFCLKDSKPCSKDAFDKKLAEIKRAKYKLLDLDTEKTCEISKENAKNLKHFILIRQSHISKVFGQRKFRLNSGDGDIKIYFTDLTVKLKPDRECSSNICREILTNINNAQNTIDIAIYGYSKTPAIEEALKAAIRRGVKIRLIYDTDKNGKNIYPDTQELVNLLAQNRNDGKSIDAQNIMHNKFYIFDDKILITGSANLSHTDMSGFNSNSIAVIKSKQVADIYKNEFEQMYAGKFHSAKVSQQGKKAAVAGTGVEVYFSPQDKSIENAVIPLICNAKKYIYIPTFVLTESRVTEELIKAKQRGVDIKIIIDALNASTKHSKHKELRAGGVPVKTENYAGKMHSKSMIIDDECTIIGSMNFSYSGENKNDENIIIIKNPQITKLYKNFFLYQWNRIDNKWLYLNARAEGKDSIGSCFDGIDNNYDGFIDSEDPACR